MPAGRPVSVLAIHGTADGVIPLAGGRVDITFSPFSDVMAKWRSCGRLRRRRQGGVDGASTTTSWTCAGGTTVAMRVIDGGCHVWPGTWSKRVRMASMPPGSSRTSSWPTLGTEWLRPGRPAPPDRHRLARPMFLRRCGGATLACVDEPHVDYLQLADWRRRIAALYAEVRAMAGEAGAGPGATRPPRMPTGGRAREALPRASRVAGPSRQAIELSRDPLPV